MKALLLLLSLGAHALAPATPAATELKLDPVTPESNRLEAIARASAFGLTSQDTEFTSVSGRIGIQLEFDPETESITELTIDSGAIRFSNMNFTLQILGQTQTVLTQNLMGVPRTSAFPPLVSTEGTVDSSNYTISLSRGTIISRGAARDSLQDLATDPIEVVGSGTGSVSVRAISDTATETIYSIALTLPLDDSQELESPPPGTTGTLEICGTVAASGTFRIFKSPFSRWAIENSLVPLDTKADFSADADRDGTPDGLLFALGQTPATASSVPLLALNGQKSLSLELGSAISQLPLVVTSTTELESGLWTEIGRFPSGSTGDLALPISPSSPARFYRLEASDPLAP